MGSTSLYCDGYVMQPQCLSPQLIVGIADSPRQNDVAMGFTFSTDILDIVGAFVQALIRLR